VSSNTPLKNFCFWFVNQLWRRLTSSLSSGLLEMWGNECSGLPAWNSNGFLFWRIDIVDLNLVLRHTPCQNEYRTPLEYRMKTMTFVPPWEFCSLALLSLIFYCLGCSAPFWHRLHSSSLYLLLDLQIAHAIFCERFSISVRFRQFYFSIKPGSRNWKIPLKSPFWFLSYTHNEKYHTFFLDFTRVYETWN